jgi:hypothetical protein
MDRESRSGNAVDADDRRGSCLPPPPRALVAAMGQMDDRSNPARRDDVTK